MSPNWFLLFCEFIRVYDLVTGTDKRNPKQTWRYPAHSWQIHGNDEVPKFSGARRDLLFTWGKGNVLRK